MLAPVTSVILRMFFPPGPMSANFLGIDLHRFDTGLVLTQLFSVSGLGLFHNGENLHAGLSHLFHRFLRDVKGQALNLEVELEARDTVPGSADLEVHVTKVIFGTDDVGEDDVLADVSLIIHLGYQPSGNSGNVCLLRGTPASISAREPPQTLAMEVEPLEDMISETTRIA